MALDLGDLGAVDKHEVAALKHVESIKWEVLNWVAMISRSSPVVSRSRGHLEAHDARDPQTAIQP
jgi:hypothetical protein